jgi:two-component system invasion response regulator UvrY
MSDQPRFMLIDDDPRVRARVRDLLANAYPEIEIVEAESAEQALVLAESGDWLAVLLDVHLRGKNGIAALPDLRRLLPNVAIVMVSAVERDPYAAAAVRAGADGFVKKERVHEDLTNALQALIGPVDEDVPQPRALRRVATLRPR